MPGLKTAVKNLATSSFDKHVSQHLQKIIGSSTISLLDVGAADGADDRWSLFRRYIDYFGVEPDARSANSVLNTDSKSDYHSESLITRALWHSPGEVTLNLCRKPMVSSIYEPNRIFLDLFPDAMRNDIVDNVKLLCETVDNIAKESETDFDVIKLDVQGAELDVLRGATSALRTAIAIEIEVEFCEIYKGQPLFDQIFSYLREHGFEFIDFLFIYRWSPDQFNGIGQSTFADALFMPAPETISKSRDEDAIRKYAVVCTIYERGDLLIRLGNAVSRAPSRGAELSSEILSLGKLLSARNARTQRQLNRVAKMIRIFHPRFRAHIFH